MKTSSNPRAAFYLEHAEMTVHDIEEDIKFFGPSPESSKALSRAKEVLAKVTEKYGHLKGN